MNNKFGVGIIGCGGISISHFQSYCDLANNCDIIAVSDVNRQAAQRFMKEFEVKNYYENWHDLLADDRIDVVSICTPHGLHATMTIAAAAAGKHIICEKPMAITVGQTMEMIEACRVNNVKLSIGSERFNPRLHFIKDHVLPLIGDIHFSQLISFFYRDNAYYQSAKWRGTWAMEGGAVCANQAAHVWDQWQWFLGGVDYAYGYWANLLHPQIEAEDIAYGLVKFRNGSHGKFLATSCCAWQDGLGGLRIEGENGTIWAKDAWCYEIDFTMHDKTLDEKLHDEFSGSIDSQYHGKFQPWQVKDLFSAIREDRPTLVPEAGEAIKILNGVHWNGWTRAKQFESWARQFDLPIAIEKSKSENWDGGSLIETLVAFVTDQSPQLKAPFLK